SNLLPQMLAKAVKQSKFTAFADLGGMECVQCGCCSYTCPARIPLTHLFNVGKAEVRKELNRQKSKEVN
ncbi:electron transport complex protein RnfC, partial [Eubacterium coprostanoligenes]